MPATLSKLGVKFPCNVCCKPVAKNHRALCCDICDQWVHVKCNHVSPADYEKLKSSTSPWFCVKCIGCVFPRSSKLFDYAMPTTFQDDDFDNSATSSYNSDTPPPDQNSSNDSSRASFLNSIFLSNSELSEPDNMEETSDLPLNCRFYDTDSLSQILKTSHSSTNHSLFHLNISSLSLHTDNLLTLLHNLEHQFSIIGISETKINSSIIPNSLVIPGYNYLHTPSKSCKGGAALFIRDDLNFFARNDLNALCYADNELESCFAELPSSVKGDPNLLVGNIYRHPSMDAKKFFNKLKKLLHNISLENKRLILLGDFNFNLLNASTDSHVIKFVDILSSYLLLPNINIPTRLTNTSKTLIDNIFCNFSDPNSISGNIISSISDHLPQFLLTPDIKANSKPINEYSYRDWSKFNREQFLLDYFEIDWNKTLKLHKQNVNTSFGFFITTINNLIDNHLPTKICKKKKYFDKLKPWITPGIIKSMAIRDKLYGTYLHCKNPTKKLSFENRYKFYRNSIVNLCRASKNCYYSNFFNTNINNSKKIWSKINSLINNKSKSDSAKCILINNVMNSNPASIAKAFNSYYSKVAESIRFKLPDSYRHFSDFLPCRNNQSIFLEPCDSDEVMWTISLLSLGKASGPHSIPVKILDLLKREICHPISDLINLSFTTGVFPSALKVAKVVAVYKNKGSPLLCSNYRPISLLSNIDKIYEKILYNRLHSFLTKHNILFPQQFGFRKSHSTSHAVLSISQKIYDALESGKFAYAVFIDLEKAFDTVDHSILLEKLNHYGIRGLPLALLKSYLSDRSQFVSISGVNSSSSKIKYGVPQGSVLGPLLFLIYINDLSRAVRHGDVLHFADDTNLLHINSSLPLLQKLCQKDLRHLCSWLNANKISLNASKTEFLCFKPFTNNDNVKYKDFTCRLKIQRNIIHPSKHLRYLGVLLDEELSWKPEINLLKSKLKRANGYLSKLRHYLPRSILLQAYYALFHSHISYCSQAWGQPSPVLKPICSLQNKAARLMTFSDYTADAAPIFSNLNLIRLADLVQTQNLVLLQKIRSFPHMLPSSLIDNLNFDLAHLRDTRGSSNGLINKFHYSTVKYGFNSIRSNCIKSWNPFLSQSRNLFLQSSFRESHKSVLDLSPAALKTFTAQYFISQY